LVVAAAGFAARVSVQSIALVHGKHLALRIVDTLLIGSTSCLRVSILALNLARVFTPDTNFLVDGAHGRVGGLDATSETNSSERIPNTVFITLASTIVTVVLREASCCATTREAPFASSLTVNLDVVASLASVVVWALLDALVGGEIELASGNVPDVVSVLSALGGILLVVVAPVGDTRLVEGPPFASGIVTAGDGVSPSALSTIAMKCQQVPDTNRVRVTLVFVVGLAALGTARSRASSPLAFGIGIAWTVGTPAEEALVFADTLRDNALIGVQEADVEGKVRALLAALVELRDPSASLSGEAGVSGEVDGTRSVAELLGVIPHAERVVVARSALSSGKLTGRDASVERSLETSVIVNADGRREDLAERFAFHELGVPLALGKIARGLSEGGPASVESASTSAVGDASRSSVARIRDCGARVTTLSTSKVDTARLSSASSSDSDGVAGVGALALRPHALRVGETASLRSDLRTLGFTAADTSGPFATRISIASRLNGVSNRALGHASVGTSVPVTNLEVGVAGRL
jgi:hypothetical protein